MESNLKPLLDCLDRLGNQLTSLANGARDQISAEDLDPGLTLTRDLQIFEHLLQEVYHRRVAAGTKVYPTRYTQLAEVRTRHGSLAEKIAPYFYQSDPLADEADRQLVQMLPPGRGKKIFEHTLARGIAAVPNAPAALRCLFAQAEDVPLWLDWDLLEVGCRAHQRTGVLGGIVLATTSLPIAYRSAAGNKALVLTGRLVERATRRMSETNRFFIDSFAPGGLKPHAPGWKSTLKVRMMHAAMRRWLRQQRKQPWKEDDWGAPINQMDMAATNLLFSVNMLRQLRKLGFSFTHREAEGVMHLWRYSGYLLGVAPELLSGNEADGNRLFDLLVDLWGTPDAHSCDLTRVLMTSSMPTLIEACFPGLFRAGRIKELSWAHAQLGQVCYGLSHGLLGDELASELDYPRTWWRFAAPLFLRSLIVPVEWCRRLLPGGTRLASHLGCRFLRQMLNNPVFARPVRYPVTAPVPEVSCANPRISVSDRR